MTRGRPVYSRAGTKQRNPLNPSGSDAEVRQHLLELGFGLRRDIPSDTVGRSNGFTDLAESVVSLTGNPADPTVEIEPASGFSSFNYYANGSLFTISSTLTVSIPQTEGRHWAWLDDSGLLQTSTSLTGDMLSLYTLVAMVYWSPDDADVIMFNDMRRLYPWTFRPTNTGTRARWGTGIEIDVPNINGPGTSDTDNDVSISDGVFWDGGAPHLVAGLSTAPASVPVYYRATNGWRKQAAGTQHVHVVSTRPAYNEFNGTSWAATEVASGSYIFMHYFAVPDASTPVICVMGIDEYDSGSPGSEEVAFEIDALHLNGIGTLCSTWLALGTVCWQVDDSYTTTPKARIVTNAGFAPTSEFRDWRLYESIGASLIDATRGGLLSNGDYTSSQDSIVHGRSTAGAGPVEELTLGEGLQIDTGVISTLPGSARLLDGAAVESVDLGWSESGGTVSATVEANGGGDVRFYFGGVVYTLDCTPICTVALTAGTDTAPQINFVYVTESGGTLTLAANTTGWPATSHAPIGTFYVQSAATTATDGPYKVHAWTDHLYSDTENGHLSHLNRKLRALNATWVSGCASSFASDRFSITTGVVYQLHEQSMPAIAMADSVYCYVPNDSSTPYKRINSIGGAGGIVADSTGAALVNNRYYNLVLWGVVNQDSGDCKLMVNLPDAGYTSESSAQADDNNTASYSFGSDFVGVGFLIGRYTLRYSTGGGGTWTESLTTDLRGLLPSTSPGGGAITDHGNLAGLSDNDHPQYALLDSGGPTQTFVQEIHFQGGAPQSTTAASGSTDLMRKGEHDTDIAGRQPLDADLTAIAALTTDTLGRSLLEASTVAAIAAITKSPYVADGESGNPVRTVSDNTSYISIGSADIPASAITGGGKAVFELCCTFVQNSGAGNLSKARFYLGTNYFTLSGQTVSNDADEASLVVRITVASLASNVQHLTVETVVGEQNTSSGRYWYQSNGKGAGWGDFTETDTSAITVDWRHAWNSAGTGMSVTLKHSTLTIYPAP